ncbi:MAG: PEP-utilizing enzyme [Candidatus Micrarchaeia archaeon]
MMDPKRELFKWGPIDARPVYLDYFIRNFHSFNQKYPSGWPETLMFIKEDRCICVLDYLILKDNGEFFFKKYILNEKERDSAFIIWFDFAKQLENFANEVSDRRLSELNNEDLKELFFKFNWVYNQFWFYGFIPELSNWGGEKYLKEKIQKINNEHFTIIYERLCAPLDISFFQKEELELLKIKLIENKEEFEKELETHQKKYYWLSNNYEDATILGVSFFRERLNRISIKDAEIKIIELEAFRRKTLDEKEKIMNEYNLNGDILEIGNSLSYSIWWQDLRKKYIFIANHYIKLFLMEFSKRYNIDFLEICHYTVDEIISLLKDNKKINTRERFSGFLFHFKEDGIIDYYTKEKARSLILPYIEKKFDKNAKEITGIAVSRGTVVGFARILHSPKEISKMKEGDILIASFTSPDYITAMRKASGIVTDEGGITCHAAIVSRELGIPCIVGTKVATKLFKDGEKIEVDCLNGTIRKV